jgi:peptidoglycan/LPS O-acetylase OafA/YrhL
LLSSIAQVSVGCKWIARLYASILLLLILNLASPIARIAPIGWLCEAGRVSYCVSLIHMPVSLAFLSTLRVVAGPIIGIEYLFVNVAAAVASFAVAAASWSYFEAPILPMGQAYTYSGRDFVQWRELGETARPRTSP